MRCSGELYAVRQLMAKKRVWDWVRRNSDYEPGTSSL